jgi:hypothetical protein
MQTGLGFFLAFCKMGKGFFPGMEGPSMAFNTHPHVAPYLYLPTISPVACYRVTSTYITPLA